MFKTWRERRQCFHHKIGSTKAWNIPVSWIHSELIDEGRRKMFWCRECGKSWIF